MATDMMNAQQGMPPPMPTGEASPRNNEELSAQANSPTHSSPQPGSFSQQPQAYGDSTTAATGSYATASPGLAGKSPGAGSQSALGTTQQGGSMSGSAYGSSPYTAAQQQYSVAGGAASYHASATKTTQYTGQPTYQTSTQMTQYPGATTGQASQYSTGQQYAAGAQYTAQAQYTGQVQYSGAQAQYTGQATQYTGGQYSTGQQYTGGYQWDSSVQQPVLDSSSRVVSRTTLGEQFIREGSRYTVTGEERVVGTREFVDESRASIVSEKVIEHEIKMPKKIVVEEIIERVVIIPERRIREEYIEEVGTRKEKIVEVAKPIITEKIIEVPEIEYVEKIVEVAELIVQEKVKEVARIEYQEKIVEVPRIVIQEKIVEVPEIEYRDVPVERIEEVIEIQEQIVMKPIPVPQYVDKPYPEYVTVEDVVDYDRNVPIPIEAITTYEFKLPQLRSTWKKVDVPLYVPRFVEIPIPLEMMEESSISQAEHYAQQISMLGFSNAVSLCELENLAKAKHVDFQSMIRVDDMTNTVIRALQSGQLQVTGTFTSRTGSPGMVLTPGAGGGNQFVTGGYTMPGFSEYGPLPQIPQNTGYTQTGGSYTQTGGVTGGTAYTQPAAGGTYTPGSYAQTGTTRQGQYSATTTTSQALYTQNKQGQVQGYGNSVTTTTQGQYGNPSTFPSLKSQSSAQLQQANSSYPATTAYSTGTPPQYSTGTPPQYSTGTPPQYSSYPTGNQAIGGADGVSYVTSVN